MTAKWKAAIVGGTVIGIGLGGFAAADDIERPSPDSLVLQQSAGSSSSGRWMKRKGVSWFPVAPAGGFSADSTFSNGSSAPAPAPAPSRGGGGSSSFGADSSFSNDSPAPAPAPSPGSFSSSGGGGGGGGG